MSTHTPGPWELSYDNGSGRDIVASPDPLPICTVKISWVGHEQYRANARLIAAAPELLEAAQLALMIAESWIHDQLDGTGALDGALMNLIPIRAAIAKATGDAK